MFLRCLCAAAFGFNRFGVYMPCYSPLTAYRSKDVGSSGKRGITFQRNSSFSGVALRLPCGQCCGCRLERSRQWAIRCMHEKMLHDDNSFVTLTYDQASLPEHGTLVKRDLCLFMKRLRKLKGSGVRFFACGEYGETTHRPHYHLLLFNCGFGDKVFYKLAKRGERLYTSETLDRLWPFGLNVIGSVDFDSCAYVARYIMAKRLGDEFRDHYCRVDWGSGEIVNVLPEFVVMSRRNGIGAEWFARFGAHAYNFDSVVMNGREMRPPRYYDTKYEVVDASGLALIKDKRRAKALEHRADNTPDRRRVRETFELHRLANSRRDVR